MLTNSSKRSPEIHSVPIPADAMRLLPDADVADAFQCTVEDISLDAGEAARRTLAYTPAWIAGLMALRDVIVAPFGLKTRKQASRDDAPRVGAFPLISQTADRVVLGFDDKHQDFRVIVDVAALDDLRRTVTMTTLVQTHNLFGRGYLAVIMPFHRVIVPAMLAQLSNPRQQA